MLGLSRGGDGAYRPVTKSRLSETDILIEDIFGYPAAGFLHPVSFQWSPDGSLLGNLFSPNGTLVRNLYAYDVRAGRQRLLATPAREHYADEAALPHEEKLRRERTRELGLGVTRFEWAKRRAHGEAPRLMVPQSDGAYVLDILADHSMETDSVLNPNKNLAVAPRLVADSGENGAAVLDARLSPDGRWVAFVRECEIRIAPCDPSDGDGRDEDTDRDEAGYLPSARVTFGAYGRECTSHGLSEFIAAEEMDRPEGFWWSPCGTKIAFARVDASTVDEYLIYHPDGGRTERHRYPFAGGTNARVTLGVVDVSPLVTENCEEGKRGTPQRTGGIFGAWGHGFKQEVQTGRDRYFARENPSDFSITWMDVDVGPGGSRGDSEEYLARVRWSDDSERLLAQVQSRDQSSVSLVRLDVRTGRRVDPDPLLTERPPAGCAWVNLAPPGTTRELSSSVSDPSGEVKAGDFVWGSWRTGHLHLYVHCGRTGVCKRAVSSGDWSVDELVGVDETKGFVYFTGAADGPTQRHLYRANLWGSDLSITRLTRKDGWNTCAMDDGCERYVCVHGSLDQPPSVEIHETSHAPTDESCSVATPIFNFKEIVDSKDLAQRFMRLTPPTLFEITAADDVTTLHGAMYIPDADTHGPPPYPCVVSVYGGPHAQTVQNSWHLTADVRAQSYRARGMVVLKLDNRGSARRGQLFERAIVGNLGACEIEDQALGVEYLVREGLVDPSRVGIFGWSYGGFLSALALSRRPEVFTCAVAGAPVARWEWYDAHYTERYMGTPESNPDGYRKSSALSGCADVAGRVLVVHGVIDENVHFRHSTSYLAALEDVGKRSGDGYVFMPFSDERHVPRGVPDRMYMEQSMQTFLEDALRPGRRDGSSRVLKRDGGPVHAPA